MIRLTDRQKEIVQNILKSSIKHGEVWAFGSRVDESKIVKKFSDLDLTFRGSPELSVIELENIKELFSASDLPFKVDICNFNDLPSAIQTSIISKHTAIYKAPAST